MRKRRFQRLIKNAILITLKSTLKLYLSCNRYCCHVILKNIQKPWKLNLKNVQNYTLQNNTQIIQIELSYVSKMNLIRLRRYS